MSYLLDTDIVSDLVRAPDGTFLAGNFQGGLGRIDPRGPQGETVMNRMCPDKYASEASAGLGVTGRWST